MSVIQNSGWGNRLFYIFKPIIPRRVQIALRRRLAQQKVRQSGTDWLFIEKAGELPEAWSGWPEGKKFAFVLRHDVELQIGHDRCLQLKDVEEKLGMRSAFYFVPERYQVSSSLRNELVDSGFEVGVHGLNHDGKLYQTKEIFEKRVEKINHYVSKWGASGFASPASHHVLEWNHALAIEYDTSTFDTAPFEPQADGVETIFPFWVEDSNNPGCGYVELPYTLTQDFYAFIILQEDKLDVWKRKLDWIAEKGGMALLITHPDYIHFGNGKQGFQEYSVQLYEDFLNYVKTEYADQYWHALPKDVASYFRQQQRKEEPTQINLPQYANREYAIS